MMRKTGLHVLPGGGYLTQQSSVRTILGNLWPVHSAGNAKLKGMTAICRGPCGPKSVSGIDIRPDALSRG